MELVAGLDFLACGSGGQPGRTPRAKVRALFGCTGWPSGVLEVASWAKHEGLAEPIIFQLQPGYACALDDEDRQYLSVGPVDPELADSLARCGRPVSADAQISATGTGSWEIRDLKGQIIYIVADEGERLDVTIPGNHDCPEFIAAIRKFARSRSAEEQFFQSDGSPRPAVRDALLACGGDFIRELIEFDPHVVGFRLEAGGLEELLRQVRAVRLFSQAEVVLGGPTATSHPAEVLEETGADYVFVGEAEESFNLFLRLATDPRTARGSKTLQPQIPGLVYRWAGRICRNTLPQDGYGRTAADVEAAPGRSRRCLRRLDRPVASAEVIASGRIDWSLLKNFRRESDSLFFTGGRGCPGTCTFCSKLHGQDVRTKSARQLLEEIEGADLKVLEGKLQVSRWDLFAHVEDGAFPRQVAWAAVYDEDFFLDRARAVEFFGLWDASPLKQRYRLSFQTNPCTLLTPGGTPHDALFTWFERLKPMIQLGAESFHPDVLARWQKRHTVEQLMTVVDALEKTRQDYTLFILLSDFDTTAEEFIESLRRLVLSAIPRRRMRIASSPFTIPLYDTDIRKRLDYGGRIPPGRVRHFSDYERPQPGWMDPLVADLADLADAELRWALQPELREAALVRAVEVVLERVGAETQRSRRGNTQELYEHAKRTMDDVREARFQAVTS